MKKIYLLFFLFFLALSVDAQDTVVAKNSGNHYTKNDIKIDTSTVAELRFAPNLKSKYHSSDFDYEIKKPEKNWWQRLLERFNRWYQRTFGVSDYKTSSNYVSYLFKTLIIVLLLFVVYIIAKLILNKEGKWIFGNSTNKKIIQYDSIEQNLKNINFEKLIADTLKNNDYRLAIRYYYLWLLKKMSEKNIIDWNAEKTNSDYVYEIKSTTLKTDFSYLSYLYENIWYGEFDLDHAAFDKTKALFTNTLQSI